MSRCIYAISWLWSAKNGVVKLVTQLNFCTTRHELVLIDVVTLGPYYDIFNQNPLWKQMGECILNVTLVARAVTIDQHLYNLISVYQIIISNKCEGEITIESCSTYLHLQCICCYLHLCLICFLFALIRYQFTLTS